MFYEVMRSQLQSRWRRIVDPLLAVTALSASAVPVLRERWQPAHEAICGLNHNLSTLTSLDDATMAVTLKICLALCAVLALLWRMRSGPAQHWLRAFAEAPILRTSLTCAVVIGVGLTAFDCCTAFHGASVDVTGNCHCWLTGVLTAIGAIVIMALLSSGRALYSVISQAMRTLIAFFLWIVAASQRPIVAHSQHCAIAQITLFDIRRVHGRRGPPVYLAF